MEPQSASAILGRFAASARWEEISPALRHEAKRALLNFIGCALGTANEPAVAMAAEVLAPFSGQARLCVIGRPERLDAMAASFVNAIAGNLLDYDDTHLATVIHPTAPVAPAALALAEELGLSGAALLHAFLLGAEIECRIGLGVSPHHYARGWHITSTCGVFGAAVAAGRSLGLGAGPMAAAIGIASSQSAGTIENLANAAKNASVGGAARNGILAALLARAGYDAAPLALEGRLGWARATGDAPDLAAMTADLGTRWEFAANTYKPYPSGIVFHAVIDACLALRAACPAERIASITVRGSQLLLDRGDRAVSNERDARVSIHHNAAVALLRGRAGVGEFAPDAVADPAVAALRAKVSAELDASLPPGAASVSIRTTDGQTAARRIDHAHGSSAHPLTDAELDAKFLANGGTRQAADALWALDTAPDIRPLAALLSAR